MAIAPATHMGAVELSVSDLERTLEYWQRAREANPDDFVLS